MQAYPINDNVLVGNQLVTDTGVRTVTSAPINANQNRQLIAVTITVTTPNGLVNVLSTGTNGTFAMLTATYGSPLQFQIEKTGFVVISYFYAPVAIVMEGLSTVQIGVVSGGIVYGNQVSSSNTVTVTCSGTPSFNHYSTRDGFFACPGTMSVQSSVPLIRPAGWQPTPPVGCTSAPS